MYNELLLKCITFKGELISEEIKVYLKKGGRIEALMVVMVLHLMIYSIAEWKLRKKLEKENESVPDQKGKPTKKTDYEMDYE